MGQHGKVDTVFFNQFCFFQMLVKCKNVCSAWMNQHFARICCSLFYVTFYCKKYLNFKPFNHFSSNTTNFLWLKCNRRFLMSIRWKSSQLDGPVHLAGPAHLIWATLWFLNDYQRFQIGEFLHWFIHTYSFCSICCYFSVFPTHSSNSICWYILVFPT